MIEDLLKQRIAWAPIGSRTIGGTVTAGALNTGVPARVEGSNRVVNTGPGTTAVSSATVYTRAPIPRAARVWLPEATPGVLVEALRVLDVRPQVDGAGIERFREVIVG